MSIRYALGVHNNGRYSTTSARNYHTADLAYGGDAVVDGMPCSIGVRCYVARTVGSLVVPFGWLVSLTILAGLSVLAAAAVLVY